MRRFLLVLNCLLAATLIGLSAFWYTRLPDRIPTHFNLAGQPDDWGSRGAFLMLSIIGLVVAGLMVVLSRAAVRNPALINMPGKEKLLALPPDAQRAALRPFMIMMDFMATLILLLFIVICVSTYRSAHGHDVSGLLNIPLFGIIALMMAAPVMLMVSLGRRSESA